MKDLKDDVVTAEVKEALQARWRKLLTCSLLETTYMREEDGIRSQTVHHCCPNGNRGGPRMASSRSSHSTGNLGSADHRPGGSPGLDGRCVLGFCRTVPGEDTGGRSPGMY
jgi:hypothetical protein